MIRIESIYQKIFERQYKKEEFLWVLMFHIVSDDYVAFHKEDLSISIASFEAICDKIRELGVNVGRLEDIGNINSPTVFFTFDDVWKSVYENAIPILKKYKFPYTVFVSQELLDKNNYINHLELKQLTQEQLCTIGFHGVRHCITRDKNEKELEMIFDSKLLSEEVERDIHVFAYPYGSIYACGKKALKRIIKQYSFCFSTINCGISKLTLQNYRHFLPRINMNEDNYINNIERIKERVLTDVEK